MERPKELEGLTERQIIEAYRWHKRECHKTAFENYLDQHPPKEPFTDEEIDQMVFFLECRNNEKELRRLVKYIVNFVATDKEMNGVITSRPMLDHIRL